MEHTYDDDPIGVNLVVHAVWESTNRRTSQSPVNRDSEFRPALQLRQRSIDRRQKLLA